MLLEKFNRLVAYGGVEASAYDKVTGEIQKSNRFLVTWISLLAYIVLAIMVIVSVFVPSFHNYLPLYASCFAACLAIWLVAKFPGKENNAVMLADMYVFAALLLLLGIVLGTVLGPKEISATYIAFLLAVPQLFTDKPYRMYILIVASVVLFIIMCLTVKDSSTWNSDITNAVLFGFISLILCTYSISNRIHRYCLQEEIRFMAENDQLTGLRNRYCYEISLEKASILESAGIYCVYVDVNGLHELNDTKGHDAGDRMLQYVGSVMQNLFGEEDTYRIGGDEFVAIGLNKSKEEIENLVATMKTAVESAGYHIATGISFREKKGIAMNTFVNEAEQAMYADKAAYYERNGIDRRRAR